MPRLATPPPRPKLSPVRGEENSYGVDADGGVWSRLSGRWRPLNFTTDHKGREVVKLHGRRLLVEDVRRRARGEAREPLRAPTIYRPGPA